MSHVHLGPLRAALLLPLREILDHRADRLGRPPTCETQVLPKVLSDPELTKSPRNRRLHSSRRNRRDRLEGIEGNKPPYQSE